MSEYIVYVWNADNGEVVYSWVIQAASAADAKAAVQEATDRRPNYAAGATKLTV